MSKDSRSGESLWFIWDGDGYELFSQDSIVFYTEDHVDLEEDVVRKALASSIQREGISDSLSGGYSLISSGILNHFYAGESLISETLSLCSLEGVLESGERLVDIKPITCVEIFNVW